VCHGKGKGKCEVKVEIREIKHKVIYVGMYSVCIYVTSSRLSGWWSSSWAKLVCHLFVGSQRAKYSLLERRGLIKIYVRLLCFLFSHFLTAQKGK
jgi:hypothetical protein